MDRRGSQTPRVEVRKARHLTAWIVLAGAADRECSVMDLSSRGAKLIAANPSELPARFELAFVKGGNRRECSVVWRRGKMLGVTFI